MISSWILLTSELHLGKREVWWPKRCHRKEVWSEGRTWATCGNKSSHTALKECLSAAYYLTCSLVQNEGMGTLFLSHVLYRSCEVEAAISSSTNLCIPLAPSVSKVPFIITLCVVEKDLCASDIPKKPLNLFAAILKAMNIFLGFGWGIFSELGGGKKVL